MALCRKCCRLMFKDVDPAICQMPPPPFSDLTPPPPHRARLTVACWHLPLQKLGLGLFLTARKRPIRAGQSMGSIKEMTPPILVRDTP